MRVVTRKVVAVALVQAIALTILAAVLPTWQDEEFTLATTAHGIAYAIHRALTYELQAPVYFAVVGALRGLNPSVLLAREFSVAMQVLTTFACAWIGRRLWPSRDPWIFCALVATNAFSVFAGVEIRTYALALLEDATLLAFFLDGFLIGSSRNARVGFIVVAVVGLYTQYFIAFDIAACLVTLVVAGRFVTVRVFLASCAIAFVVFIPQALVARTQGGALSVESSIGHHFGGMLLHPINFVLSAGYYIVPHSLESWVWLAFKIAAIAALVFGRPRFDRRTIAIAALFVSVDLIYVVLNDVAKINLVPPRHFIALFFPEAMLAYAIVAAFAGRYARQSAICIALVIALANALVLARTYAAGAKLGDARRVGAFLSANAEAGDAIAVFPGDGVAPIVRYYRGTIPIEGYPVPQDLGVYQIDGELVRSGEEATAAFARLPHAKRLWFAMLGTCGSNTHGCVTIRAAMAARYRVLRETDFYQAVVFELEPAAK